MMSTEICNSLDPEKRRKYSKTKWMCAICGEIIDKSKMTTRCERTARMHEQCVVNDAVNTISSGKRLNNMQRKRLYRRGYSVTDIKEIIREEIHEGKTAPVS